MKLCVSNIAWERHDDPQILERLRAEEVAGIEVAPTKIWPDWAGASSTSAAAYRNRLADEGFEIPSMQAILFGRLDLLLFGTTSQVRAFLDHIRFVADLAQALGARSLVYGAPKSRDPGTMSPVAAAQHAAEVFAEAGEACAARGACLCIEPNPRVYGCTFVTNSREGRELVEQVGSPGFRLHLDAAGMTLAGEDIASAIPLAAKALQHFHASEPNLGSFSSPTVDHAGCADALHRSGYKGWISIEMRPTATPLDDVVTAVRHVKAAYLPVLAPQPDEDQAKKRAGGQ